MKKIGLIFLFSIFLLNLPAQSASVLDNDETKAIRPHAYRLGTSTFIEKKYNFEAKPVSTKKVYTKKDFSKCSYADLNIKNLSKEIFNELDSENAQIESDMRILWLGAASKSETIKFAIYKLSNPEKDKASDSVAKKLLKPIAGISTIFGSGVSDPFFATTAIIGGNLLSAFSVDNKDLNYKFSKVNDADMIVLFKKVEDLQKKLLTSYFDYMKTLNSLKMVDNMVLSTYKSYEDISTSSVAMEQLLIADTTYIRNINLQKKLQAEFLQKRGALEQIVGTEAIIQLEQAIKNRDIQNDTTKN